MSRPKRYGEYIYLRLPDGSRDLIHATRGDEELSDWLRSAVREKLERNGALDAAEQPAAAAPGPKRAGRKNAKETT